LFLTDPGVGLLSVPLEVCRYLVERVKTVISKDVFLIYWRKAMSDNQHDHPEDNEVNIKVALFLVVVIGVIIFLGFIN
jgi:hypothetical protein